MSEHLCALPTRPARAARRTPSPRVPSSRVQNRIAATVLALTALGAGPAGATGSDTPAPNPRLPQVEIQAGMHVIRAEVAADSATRTRGLMMRERLGPNEGMLFVFPDRAGHCFWMRNTLIPLSIAFVDDDGTIANIADMTPRSDDSHCPVRAVRYALEMEQGWFARRGLKAGARLVQPRYFRPAATPSN
jgi:uncharacterized membrane protein (UPF0127 family)